MDINYKERKHEQKLQAGSKQRNKLTEQKLKRREQTAKLREAKKHSSENVFKYISIGIIFVFIFCFPSIFRFRKYSQTQEIPIISINIFYYAFGSFLFIYFGKYRFYDKAMPKLVKKLNLVNPNLPANEISSIQLQISKQFYDFIRYSTLSILALWLFAPQNWFPFLLGGSSEQYCPQWFRSFPAWPTHLQAKIEFYCGVQAGINLYDFFQLSVLKRKQYILLNNFYELLLHHIITSFLIILSALNLVTSSIIAFFLHDISETFRAAARVFVISKYQPIHNKLSLAIDVSAIAVWIYMRIIFLPLCLLNQMIESRQILHNPKYNIGFQFDFQIFLGLSIFALHNFWTVLMVKGAYGRYCRRLTLKSQSVKMKE